jgi:hypothetical protein
MVQKLISMSVEDCNRIKKLRSQSNKSLDEIAKILSAYVKKQVDFLYSNPHPVGTVMKNSIDFEGTTFIVSRRKIVGEYDHDAGV